MNSEIKKIWADVYTWKCPTCGKELKSLWEPQLEANIREHKRKH